MIKRTIVLLVSFICFSGYAQDGFKFGVELSPSWHINIQRQTPGVISNTTGYGFNVGVPVRWGFSEKIALKTGLNFELMFFDVRFDKTLISSNRHGSLNLPLLLDYQLSGGWYLIFGAGANYNFMNKQWTQLGKINISGSTNVFQPYFAAGISTIMDRDLGDFELGVLGRYHFIDMYKNIGTGNTAVNWILSFDLLLRYYLFGK